MGLHALSRFFPNRMAQSKKLGGPKKNIPFPRKILWMRLRSQAVKICKNNLRAAGFGQEMTIIHGDFQDAALPFSPNFVMTNPPHGLRLGETDSLRPVYRALGDFLNGKQRSLQKDLFLPAAWSYPKRSVFTLNADM